MAVSVWVGDSTQGMTRVGSDNGLPLRGCLVRERLVQRSLAFPWERSLSVFEAVSDNPSGASHR